MSPCVCAGSSQLSVKLRELFCSSSFMQHCLESGSIPWGNVTMWRSWGKHKVTLLIFFSQGAASGHPAALGNLRASWKVLLKECKGRCEEKRAKTQADNKCQETNSYGDKLIPDECQTDPFCLYKCPVLSAPAWFGLPAPLQTGLGTLPRTLSSLDSPCHTRSPAHWSPVPSRQKPLSCMFFRRQPPQNKAQGDSSQELGM